MKLRIRGNSIRLRLNQTEVTNLGKQIAVEEKTDFGNENFLVYSVVPTDKADKVTAEFQNGRIEIYLPIQTARSWAESEEVGISAEQGELKLLIEKDFACLAPRNPEEDTDAFPHPKSEKFC
ncbi:MAG: hypothetical protein K1X72_06715 [Pyrinomonadaceae bacterium]|nr:hypothetical protein [Pyrinomonadaceae bacterium]